MSDIIKFYKSNDPYGFLNNFKKSRMFIYEKWFNNTETAYQFKKTNNVDEQTMIWSTKTPREARNIGQKVQIRLDWDLIKDHIMYDCVFAKFTQNHEFLKLLLDTNDAILVEESITDFYWGCGDDGSGRNQLGKTLMKVRENLKGF